MTKPISETILKKGAGERRWPEAATYFTALVLCLWALERLLKLRRSDLGTPFLYEGDGLFYSMVIKAIITNGWYLTNPWLGAPHGQELYDFPQPDNLSYFMVKLMGLFTSNYATVFNLFYLLTYPLTTVSALYVLRKFGVSRASAVLASLLYTFTYYHLSRSQHHLMYITYYSVPLIVMVMLWTCSEKLSVISPYPLRPAADPAGGAGRGGRLSQLKLALRNPKWAAGLLACALIASTGGAYFSFFAAWLLASVAIYLGVRRRSFAAAATPLILIAVIFGALMINLAPNLVYRLTHDKAAAAQRVPAEAEIYGLKIAQLLSPVTLHRLKSFAKFRETYDKTPLSNENIDSSLGLIGSVGFLFLIGWLLYRRGRDEADWSAELFNHLSLLNISAVLVGTIGGFGALFSHLVSPQIRAYNRISVFIAFFSLFSTALLLDRLSRRFFQQGSRRIAFYVLIPLLILLGVLDQTKKNFAPDYKGVKAEFLNDREFVRQIEAGVPERGMIFQLPVQVFPEGESYEHLKGYLHSDKLRWSYGAMRGREGGNWQAMVAAMPVSEMIDTIAVAGFSGVWIDRSLYPDSGAAIESAISTQLQTRPLLSPTQRRSFFNLIEYGKKIGGDPDKVIHPLIPKWQSGFSDLEGTPEDNWRWCSTTGEVRLENLSTRDRQVAIEMTASSLTKGKLKIEGKNFSETIQISPVNTPFSKQLTIPPGPYTIRFTSDTPAVQHLPDPRLLSFRINNFKMKEVEQ